MDGILNAVLMAFMDRVRGDKFGLSKGIETVVYGWLVASAIGYSSDLIKTPLIIAAFTLGASIGWGKPYGAYVRGEPMQTDVKLHWWQFGVLKTNVKMAIIFRGLLWALPLFIVGELLNDHLIGLVGAAYFLSFCIAIFVTKDWEYSEWMRGLLAGLFLLVIQL